MRLTKRQLKRIIREEYSRLKRRGLIKESVNPMDIEDLCDVIVFNVDDWMGYSRHYNKIVMDLRVNHDEMADDFLFSFDLDECPSGPRELCDALRDPEVQQHPMFKHYFDMLYGAQ